jgi:hypothetical protein
MDSHFEIQPIGRFVGQSAAIKRPKVSTEPPFLMHSVHEAGV